MDQVIVTAHDRRTTKPRYALLAVCAVSPLVVGALAIRTVSHSSTASVVAVGSVADAGAKANTDAAAPEPFDPKVVERDFDSLGMAFTPADSVAAATIERDAAVQTAAANEGLEKSAASAETALGYWTSAERSPDQIEAKVRILADHRLVWLVRFSGLKLAHRGLERSQTGENHELNVMVDATTGDIVGSVSYR